MQWVWITCQTTDKFMKKEWKLWFQFGVIVIPIYLVLRVFWHFSFTYAHGKIKFNVMSLFQQLNCCIHWEKNVSYVKFFQYDKKYCWSWSDLNENTCFAQLSWKEPFMCIFEAFLLFALLRFIWLILLKSLGLLSSFNKKTRFLLEILNLYFFSSWKLQKFCYWYRVISVWGQLFLSQNIHFLGDF